MATDSADKLVLVAQQPIIIGDLYYPTGAILPPSDDQLFDDDTDRPKGRWWFGDDLYHGPNQWVLTDSTALLDAHGEEVLWRDAYFRWYAHTSAADLIASKTTAGYLSSYISCRTGRIEHHWVCDH